VLFDQIIEADKACTRYVPRFELGAIASDVEHNQVAIIQVLLQP
jgi:hypothetical protein